MPLGKRRTTCLETGKRPDFPRKYKKQRSLDSVLGQLKNKKYAS